MIIDESFLQAVQRYPDFAEPVQSQEIQLGSADWDLLQFASPPPAKVSEPQDHVNQLANPEAPPEEKKVSLERHKPGIKILSFYSRVFTLACQLERDKLDPRCTKRSLLKSEDLVEIKKIVRHCWRFAKGEADTSSEYNHAHYLYCMKSFLLNEEQADLEQLALKFILMPRGERQRYFLDGLLLKFKIEYDLRVGQVRESA